MERVNPVLAAAAAMTLIAGIVLLVAGLRQGADPLSRPPARSLLRSALARRNDARTLAGVGLAGGVLVWLVTGWLIAVVIGPVLAVGVPFLLAPTGAVSIARLDAMAEWTRSMAGVLGVGVGLEQALIATQRSTPEQIRPQVNALIARLRARWSTEAALRAFAEDLDDSTGDLVAAALILGSRRRGAGLAKVLTGLADSVASEVRARRQIETDRAKPRATARWVTLITLGVVGLMFLNTGYMAPYSSPLGQLILATLLAAYGGALLWLRNVAAGKPTPRFMGVTAKEATR